MHKLTGEINSVTLRIKAIDWLLIIKTVRPEIQSASGSGQTKWNRHRVKIWRQTI